MQIIAQLAQELGIDTNGKKPEDIGTECVGRVKAMKAEHAKSATQMGEVRAELERVKKDKGEKPAIAPELLSLGKDNIELKIQGRVDKGRFGKGTADKIRAAAIGTDGVHLSRAMDPSRGIPLEDVFSIIDSMPAGKAKEAGTTTPTQLHRGEVDDQPQSTPDIHPDLAKKDAEYRKQRETELARA